MPDRDGHILDLGETPIHGSDSPSAKNDRPSSRFASSVTAEARPNAGRGGRPWGALLLLYVVVAGVFGYDYWVLRNHQLRLADLSSALGSITGLSQRLDAAEHKFQVWGAYQDGLAEKLRKLDVKVNVDFRRAQKQAREEVARARQEIIQEVDLRTQRIDARLSGLESTGQADHARLAQLGEEMTSVRRELAASRESAGRDLQALRREEGQSQERLRTLSRQVDRRRVDFEVNKGEERYLTPEISMSVSATDLRYELYSGWLWYEPDQQTIWIVDQGVQQPVVFRNRQNGQPFELIVTSVSKNGVVGYLLLPVEGAQPGQASARVGAEAHAERPGS